MLDATSNKDCTPLGLAREASPPTKVTTMPPRDLPSDARKWPEYNFSKNWETEVYPLIRDDYLFAKLTRSAVTDFVLSHGRGDMAPPSADWDIFGEEGPASYTAPNYAQCQRCDVVDHWLASGDPVAVAVQRDLAKYDEWDNEFYEIYEPLKIAYGPQPWMHQWFKLGRGCHWIAAPMHRALTLLRPSHDIRVVETDQHSFVVDLTDRQIFDILLAGSKTNSVDFARGK